MKAVRAQRVQLGNNQAACQALEAQLEVELEGVRPVEELVEKARWRWLAARHLRVLAKWAGGGGGGGRHTSEGRPGGPPLEHKAATECLAKQVQLSTLYFYAGVDTKSKQRGARSPPLPWPGLARTPCWWQLRQTCPCPCPLLTSPPRATWTKSPGPRVTR